MVQIPHETTDDLVIGTHLPQRVDAPLLQMLRVQFEVVPPQTPNKRLRWRTYRLCQRSVQICFIHSRLREPLRMQALQVALALMLLGGAVGNGT